MDEIDLQYRQWHGGIETGPPQILASTERAPNLQVPKVRKIPNSRHGICLLCKACCCYILAAWQLESSRLFLLWLQTVSGVAWCGWMQFIELLGPGSLLLKGTFALHSSSVVLAKQHNMSICLGERRGEGHHSISGHKYQSIGQTWIEFSGNYLSFMYPPSCLWAFSSFHSTPPPFCQMPTTFMHAQCPNPPKQTHKLLHSQVQNKLHPFVYGFIMKVGFDNRDLDSSPSSSASQLSELLQIATPL